MLSYKEYRKLVDNEEMINYIRSFREMGKLHVINNRPPDEDLVKHVEYVAKNQQSFIGFLLLCDRLDRRDLAFTNLSVYHTILTTTPLNYKNFETYVNLSNESVLKDGPIQDIIRDALDYRTKDEHEGKLEEAI